MRRAGQLENAEEFLKKAETNNHNAPMIAGYNYCRGLHYWLDIHLFTESMIEYNSICQLLTLMFISAPHSGCAGYL